MKRLLLISAFLVFSTNIVASPYDAEIVEICTTDGRDAGFEGSELSSFIELCKDSYQSDDDNNSEEDNYQEDSYADEPTPQD